MKKNKDKTDPKDEQVEEPDVEEIPDGMSEDIREKVVNENPRWLAFYDRLREKLRKTAAKHKGHELLDYVLLLPDFFILLVRLLIDSRVPPKYKGFLAAITAYLISPIDLIPDFIPIGGYLDDLVVVVFGLNMILNGLGETILVDNWSGRQDLLKLLQKLTAVADNLVNRRILEKIRSWLNKRSPKS